MHRKSSSRKENRRLDHKAERAAVRQVIHGGHPRQPSQMNWSSSAPPVPIIDDVMPHRAHKTGCPKNHGGAHFSIPNPKRTFYRSQGGYGWWHGPETVCQYCNKSLSYGNWWVRDADTVTA